MKKIILLLSPLLLLLQACKTDFDVTGEWKEITVVYGILDKNEGTHYIRINKGFLGEEDAYRMAEENDSINFSNLTVTLTELTESGAAVDSFVLDTTYVTLENGIFGNPGNQVQKLWKTNETLDPSRTYRVRVVNNFSGKVTTAETPLVKDFSIAQPSISSQSKITFVGNNDAYTSNVVRFSPAANGIVYEITIVFYYRDVNILTNDTVLNSISWKQTPYVTDGNETTIQLNIAGESFYNYIGSVVPPIAANYKRLIGKGEVFLAGNATDHIDVNFVVGGKELYDYIEINKPAASGVLLDKPVYTNIENGLGIFSTRTTKSVPAKELSVKSIHELKTGTYTGNLGFVQELN